MSTKINLQSIRKYNPSLLKDEDVINNFLVRQKTFHKLINQIINEEQDSIPQHHLIIGQRGMGKTTLLKRIEVEVRHDDVLSANFVPLQFPEELYNIDRLSKFWLNTIDVLIDYLEIINEKNLCRKFELQLNGLLIGGEHSFMAEDAYILFMAMMSEIQKRPILLIDNLDLVFEGLHSDEQWQLREKMSKSGAPIFIGASAAPFDAVFEYKQAFYDYFKLTTLDPLSYESFYDLIISLAESLEDEKIKSSFYTNQNRIKTLFRLTGGNIRTAIILFSSLSSGFGTNVSDDLEKLLDEVTPIYKARVDELSDQMRTIADTIALYWDPIDLQKIRDITFLENNTLSPQIRRLRQMGWITKVPSSKTKGDKYEMTERFFNVWYLMRRSTRRHRKNITCLSKFIEEYYGEETTQIAKSLLLQPVTNENDVVFRLALSETIKDKELKDQFESNTQNGLNLLSESEPEIYHRLGISNETTINFDELIKNKKYQEADDWLSKIIKLFPKNETIKYLKGNLNLIHLRNYGLAETEYLDVAKISPNYTELWNNLGILYYHLKMYDKAKEAYLKAIKIDAKSSYPWINIGILYHNYYKEFEKSKESYLKAVEIDSTDPYIWNNLGNLYQEGLQEFEKSEQSYLKAIELDSNDPLPLNGLGNLYSKQFKEYDKAKEFYLKAISIDSKISFIWYNLGNLYFEYYKNYDKAKDAYFKAVEIDSNFANPWNALGNLYQDHFKEYEKAKDAYSKAIECAPDNTAATYNLIFLLRDLLDQRVAANEKFKAVKIDIKKEMIDTYFLHQSLFHVYDLNFGLASESLKLAIEKLDNNTPVNTFDDWIRYASVAIKKGFGSEMITIFKENKIDVIMRPYFEACVAYQNKDKDHFQDIAVEVREIAKEIYDQIVSYLK